MFLIGLFRILGKAMILKSADESIYSVIGRFLFHLFILLLYFPYHKVLDKLSWVL